MRTVSPFGVVVCAHCEVDDSFATDLAPGAGAVRNLFLRDLCTGAVNCTPSTTPITYRSDGTRRADGDSFTAFGLSGDGRYVAFNSAATNLVGTDDANGTVPDTFLWDRTRDRIRLVSLGPDGRQLAAGVYLDWDLSSISGDGRFVGFASPVAGVRKGFLFDAAANRSALVAGSTEVAPNGTGRAPHIDYDGDYVGFVSAATNVTGTDTDAVPDGFVTDRRTGMTALLSANVPVAGEPPTRPQTLDVRVSADGRNRLIRHAGRLTPDDMADETKDFADCFVRVPDTGAFPPGSDLSGDGDYGDGVLYVVDSTQALPQPPIRIAEGAGLSIHGSRAAFLLPESLLTGSLNGDADPATAADPVDTVVHLYTHDYGDPEHAAAHIVNLRCQASNVTLTDSVVVALVSEEDQGQGSLNGDADTADDVVLFRDANLLPPTACRSDWTSTGIPARAFRAVGGHIAMRSPENQQGAGTQGTDMNGDGDTTDTVFRIYDTASVAELPALDHTGHFLAARDVVLGDDIAAFHAREADGCRVDQATPPLDATTCKNPAAAGCAVAECDLNDDNDCCDDVLHAYDIAERRLINSYQAVTPCPFEACDPLLPYRVRGYTVRFLTYEGDQGPADTGTDLDGNGRTTDFVLQTFNTRALRTQPVSGIAVVDASTGDPIAGGGLKAAGDGSVAVVTAGVCTETFARSCAEDTACRDVAGFCEGGACKREHGRCSKPADCPPPTTCDGARLVVPASADDDDDGVLDALDTCPRLANPDQADRDGDGVGDACDTDQTCGDGTVQPGESCDDGNATANDGCERDCSPTPVCGDLGAVGVLTSLKLTMRALGGAPGRQSVTISGKLSLPAGTPAGSLDLDANGLQLLIEDLGGRGRAPLDLSWRRLPVPPNDPESASCDPRGRDGWSVNRAKTIYTYVNRSNAFPSAFPEPCEQGSALGLAKLRVVDKRASATKTIDVKVTVRKATIERPVGPLRLTLALGAAPGAGSERGCAAHAFPAAGCTANAAATTMVCR